MKMYKIITDNLDWLECPKNMIFSIYDTKDFLGSTLNKAVTHHPEWFEEIIEKVEPKQFTRKDMVVFGRYCVDMNHPPIKSIDLHALDNWVEVERPEFYEKPKE